MQSKVSVFFSFVLAAVPAELSAQYLPPDVYFSGGGPAYSPAPQADHVAAFSPTGLTTSAYQWWANNLPAGPGPRNAGAARAGAGDLPPVAFQMADLRLPWAWETPGAFDERVSGLLVKVAIISDGIETTHPDFAAGASGIPAIDEDSDHHRNFVTGTNTPSPMVPATDKQGTALAGIIAARHGSGAANTGIAGIAPGSRLQSLIASKGALDDFRWAESFAWGSTLTDADSDGSLFDEVRAGNPYCEICLNAPVSPDKASDLFPESYLWQRAISHGATSGRNTKGVVYVTPAGDGADGHMNTNYMQQKNSIYQIPVTAVSDMGRRIGYANPGANIVCAGLAAGGELPPLLKWPSPPAAFPSLRPFIKDSPVEPDDVPAQWRRRTQGIATLSTGGTINFNFSGTAAAAAQVAGIVALMLEKRPDLTTRDVKEILLRSGRVVNDVRYDTNNEPLEYEPAGPGSAPQQTYPWPANGPHPPVTIGEGPTQWRMGRLGRPLHHALGAGLIDARRALKIAGRWVLLPLNPLPGRMLDLESSDFGQFISTRTTETGGIYFPVPASRIILQTGQPTEVLVPSPPAGMRVEHVEVRVRAFHERRGDLEIKLVAPGELAWDGAGRTMVSDLFVPHREDFNEDHWDYTNVDLRDPLDWTFSTVRHWGTTISGGSNGFWKVIIRDAINKGATTTVSANDPVYVPAGNPVNNETHRLEGIAITYHGVFGGGTTGMTPAWDPPVVITSQVRAAPSPGVQSFSLQVRPLTAGGDGQPAFPLTSWDFFHLPDIVPVHEAAPAASPFEYFPPGTNSASGVPPAEALYPDLQSWPALPVWVPLTKPPLEPGEPAGAMVSRPQWAEFSGGGRFLILRDSTNFDPERNFIHVRLNRALGVLDVIPWNPGNYSIRVIAENLVGISQPKQLNITVPDSEWYFGGWRYATFNTAEFADPAISGPEADPDRDDYNNLLEYFFASDPRRASTARDPIASVTETDGRRYATLTFTKRSLTSDTTGAVEFSSDLQVWDEPAELVSSDDNADGTVTVTYRSANPLDEGQERLFGRVLVSLDP